MNILVFNAGSSSLKARLIDPASGKALVEKKVERIAAGQLDAAVASVLTAIEGHPVAAVAHRVVHGGARFTGAALLDDDAIAAIEACVPLAPLHNPANLAGIRAAKKALPALPQIAVFDTAFHARMPRRATTYAIDTALA